MGRGKSGKRQVVRRQQPNAMTNESAMAGMMVARQTMVSTYSGPTPPVEVLEGYERVAPGSAKQILDQFIKQSNHRMELETRVIKSDIVRSWGGLAAGFVIALAFLGCGSTLVAYGHDTAGATLATASLAGLVGVFVYGTKSQRKEREQKAKIMAEAKKLPKTR